MRRGPLAVVLIAFLAWFLWKGLPFLTTARPAIWSTPTSQATDPAALAPVKIRRGQRACLDQIDFGPQAKYVAVTLKTPRPSPPIRIEARAAGYTATGRIAPGIADNGLAIAPIPAADRETTGTLCFADDGRYAVSFYGIAPGRGSSPSTTTIEGRQVPQDLSVTLMTNPSQSLGSRLGDVAGHLAAFRPVTGWEVFLLGLLAVLAVPVALGVAIARSVADDEDREGRPGDGPPGAFAAPRDDV
jgi:hypothetical protein